MKYALVTGASSGIGKASAKLFAKKGYSLILVSRNRKELDKVKEEIMMDYSCDIRIYACDLIEEDAPEKLHQSIMEDHLNVEILMNNAGFGDHGEFLSSDYQKQVNMINLNITALTKMCYLFGNDFVTQGHGKILNVSSIAAFSAGPYMSVYYATKAYVLSFSQALQNELQRKGVNVTCLCPGPTKTKFFDVAQMKDSPVWKYMPPASVERVAYVGVMGLLKGKSIVINNLSGHILNISSKILPRSFVTHIVGIVNGRR